MAEKHWTDIVRVNRKFMSHLRQELTNARITNAVAYDIYVKHCARRTTCYRYDRTATVLPKARLASATEDPWIQMNVRNQLCKMEHLELIIRIAPGYYRWNEARWEQM